MPRSFSDQEITAIRERLLSEGRRLFERYGLGRTTVDDLARAAGIAKGSFYKFFGSKELLCMELLEIEEERIKSAVLETARSERDARAAFLSVMESMLEFMRTDSLMVRLRELGDYDLLARTVESNRLDEHFRQDLATAEALLDVLRKKGGVCDVDAKVFAGLLRGVAMLLLHEEEIGREVARPALRLLMSYVADGLIGPKQ
ncbi:TetR/AcrR family transcriptional regulator [Salinispira pacifica]